MPLTDSYAQNVPYPTLTDKPNAQTMGQGIVEGVIPRTVMRFPSAVVRGATIAVPQAGMVTWLKDVGRLEVFDGESWSVITAGKSTWKTITPNIGFSQNGNDQGTFAYRVINLFGEMGIMFRGGLTINYVGGQFLQSKLNTFDLPVEARPSSLRTLVIPCSDVSSERVTLKLDVKANGELILYGIQTGTKPPWIGFNGVFCAL